MNESGEKCLYNCFSKVVDGNVLAISSLNNEEINQMVKEFKN